MAPFATSVPVYHAAKVAARCGGGYFASVKMRAFGNIVSAKALGYFSNAALLWRAPMRILRFLALAIVFSVSAALRAQPAAQVWIARYNGPANGNDASADVAVDSAGDVVVTGFSSNASNNRDYYTAKYAAANGALLWEKRYNGPGNGDDQASSIAVDAYGNVAITGVSKGLNFSGFYTAKYAGADGALLWEKRYEASGPGGSAADGVAFDSAGDVIVSGYSNTSVGGFPIRYTKDYYTAKYRGSDGLLLWEKRYNGPGDSNDNATCMTLDATGNVIVSGQSANNYLTFKYAAASGALLWEKRYSGPGSGGTILDWAESVAVDAAGNVSVTGYSLSTHSFDIYTAKYAGADGALLWERRYDAPAHGDDRGVKVATDSEGNVAVTGSFKDANNVNYYTYTAKYAADNGALQWAVSNTLSNNFPNDIAIDIADNVVITGFSGGYSTYKYAAADGHLLWEAHYNQSAIDEALAVALAADGGVVVTGHSGGDIATFRYAPPAGDADGDGLQDWWEQMWWGTTAGYSAFDDFDRDGIPELLEMAFGLNPKLPDKNALPQPFVEGGYLTMGFTKHHGVTYEVQSAATPDASAFTAATTTVLMDNATTLKVRDNIPIGTPPARYLRVKVTAVP